MVVRLEGSLGRMVVALTEKGVRQCNGIYSPHIRVLHEIRINEEENRHVDRLPCIQPLFFETEALYFTKVWRNLWWRNAVCCNANDITLALV